MSAESGGQELIHPAPLDAHAVLEEIDLGALGSRGITIYGADAGDRSGRSVSDAGDVNGDGFDDVIIGAELADGANNATEDAGSSYLLFGSADFSKLEALDLAELGNAGIALHGVDVKDFSGKVVSSAGDVNGDGFDDLLIGAGQADGIDNSRSSVGETYLIFGRADLSASAEINLGSLGDNGVILYGIDAFDNSGWLSVGLAGDVNGDGLDDLIIGAPLGDSVGNEKPSAGESYLVFGRENWPRTVDLESAENIVRIEGNAVLDKSGWAVSAVGDINGDGLDDVAIGAPNAAPPSSRIRGIAYVIYGKTDWSQSPTISLGSLGSDGLTIYGADVFDDNGAAISHAGDVNGDGLDDLLIGAYSANSINNSRPIAGESYLLFGRTTWPASGIVELQEPSPLRVTIFGARNEDRNGRSVSGAGDVNGDGYDDIVIGSENGGLPGSSKALAGETYVLFGGPDWPQASIDLANPDHAGLILTGANASDLSGRSVSRAGDVDGDGFDDIVIGAFFADGPGNQRSRAGDSYVVFGNDFSQAVTDLGTNAADTIVGDVTDDVIVAGQGDDLLLSGGGRDVLRMGQGHDVVIISSLEFRRIDGGNGTDTLRIDWDGTADLTKISRNRLSSIEQIDLSASNVTRLRLNRSAVLNLSDESNLLVVDAGPEDQVELGSGWSVVAEANDDYVVFRQGFATVMVTPRVGDSNLDGVFNSADLIKVLQAGEYEDNIPNNSTFAEGDWNGDGEFTSSDFLIAFQHGTYQTLAVPVDTRAISAALQTTITNSLPDARSKTPQRDSVDSQLASRKVDQVVVASTAAIRKKLYVHKIVAASHAPLAAAQSGEPSPAAESDDACLIPRLVDLVFAGPRMSPP